jgi:hypothetical protein
MTAPAFAGRVCRSKTAALFGIPLNCWHQHFDASGEQQTGAFGRIREEGVTTSTGRMRV